jgi:hypothetical protein
VRRPRRIAPAGHVLAEDVFPVFAALWDYAPLLHRAAAAAADAAEIIGGEAASAPGKARAMVPAAGCGGRIEAGSDCQEADLLPPAERVQQIVYIASLLFDFPLENVHCP